MILRTLIALLWLHGRMTWNQLTHARRRGALEGVSRILEVVAPVFLGILFMPAFLGAMAAGFAGGWYLTRPGDSPHWVGMVCLVVYTGTLFWLPMRLALRPEGEGQLARSEFLRLQPIPRSLLHHLELVQNAVDPILLLLLAATLALPLGSILGGRPVLALWAFTVGLVFWFGLLSGATLLSLARQLVFRDRRRQEWLALLGFLCLLVFSLIPQLLPRHSKVITETKPVGPSRASQPSPWRNIPPWFHYLPSGLAAQALQAGATGSYGQAVLPAGSLLLGSLLLYGLSRPAYRRLLEQPAGSRSSVGPKEKSRDFTIPLLSPTVTGLAWTHLRTYLRTVIGKIAVVNPLICGVLFSLPTSSFAKAPFAGLSGTLLMTSFASLVSLSAFAANQFAVVGRGLLLEFLQPVTCKDLVRGRLLAIFLMNAFSAGLGFFFLMVTNRQGPVLVIPTVYLIVLGSACCLAPLDILLSAVFPRYVVLNSMGRAAAAHWVPNLVHSFGGMAVAILAGALILLPWWFRQMTWLSLLLSVLWVMLTWSGAFLLAGPVGQMVANRRENLALVAAGR